MTHRKNCTRPMGIVTIGVYAVLFAHLLIKASDAQDTKPKIPDKFETVVKVNFWNDSRIAVLKIAYDKEAKRGSIFRTEGGVQEHYIYELDAKKFVRLFDSNCSYNEIVTEQEKSLDSALYFPFFLNEDSSDVAENGNEVLKFTGDLEPGNGAVLDGSINQWKKKITFTPPDEKYESFTCDVTFSFSDPSVPTTLCKTSPCPVQLLHIEEECDLRVGKKRTMFEFYEFSDTISDPTVFVVPPGTFCSTKPPGTSFPDLPDVWSIRLEVRESEAVDLNFRMEEALWYDNKRLLVRKDYEEVPETDQDFYIKNDVTTIDDYFHGLTYRIINNGESCTVHALNDAMPRPEAVLLGIDEHLRVGRQEIGQRPCRGRQCQVWAIQFPSKAERDKTKIADVRDVYFGKEVRGEIENGAIEAETFYSPVYSQLYPSISAQKTQKMNFYHFQTVTPDVNIFDVSPCFKASQKVMLSLKLEGPHEAMVHEAPISFRQKLMETLNKAMNVKGSVRLNRLKISVIDDNTASVTVILVEDPLKLMKAGASAKDATPDISVKEALSALEKNIKSGKLELTFKGEGDKKEQKFKITEYTTDDEVVKQTVRLGAAERGGKYTGGDLAGATIGTMFLGIFLAVASLFACFKFRKDMLVAFFRAKQ